MSTAREKEAEYLGFEEVHMGPLYDQGFVICLRCKAVIVSTGMEDHREVCG